MYRLRVHSTVVDLDGWNEMVSIIGEINALRLEKGHSPITLWTETIGVFDHLVAETEYSDMATFEAETGDLYSDPKFGELSRRMSAVTVTGKSYTELMETATDFGG